MLESYDMIALAYLLPTGKEHLTLWSPMSVHIGELPETRLVILSPVPVGGQRATIQRLIHDNVYRPRAWRGLGKRRAASYWFRMLWGFIYLLSSDNPKEDWLCGLYLLIGAPFLSNVMERIWERRHQRVLANFNAVTYLPDVEIVVSPRLQELHEIVAQEGPGAALRHLYRLGLPQLIGFYRRAAWAGRWTTPPPTGLGVFTLDRNNLQAPVG